MNDIKKQIEEKRELYRKFVTLKHFNILFLFVVIFSTFMGGLPISIMLLILYGYFLVLEKEIGNRLKS